MLILLKAPWVGITPVSYTHLDSGIGVPFAQKKILNLNLEYAMTTRVIALDLDGTLLTVSYTHLQKDNKWIYSK